MMYLLLLNSINKKPEIRSGICEFARSGLELGTLWLSYVLHEHDVRRDRAFRELLSNVHFHLKEDHEWARRLKEDTSSGVVKNARGTKRAIDFFACFCSSYVAMETTILHGMTTIRSRPSKKLSPSAPLKWANV